MLSKRDKAIINDLNRFRVMSLTDIADIHFKGLKRPSNSANNVLNRLYRDGKIKRSTSFQPYVYYGPDTNLKENSAKIGHYLAIVETYKDITNLGEITQFNVEPKYGAKGTVEPDIFCIALKTPFFIEVQRILYSEKVMKEKLQRYENLFSSGIIQNEPWQPKDREPVFPYVLILSQHRYAIDSDYPFRVFQAESFEQFLSSIRQKQQPTVKSNNGSIKIRV